MFRRSALPLFIVVAVLCSAAPASGRSRLAVGIIDTDGLGPSAASVIVELDEHTARVGRSPHLWALSSRWGARGGDSACDAGEPCAFPTEAVAALHARGITPVVWWVPVNPGDWEAGTYERYSRIVRKKHDAYIRRWARDARDAARAGGKPVIVRFAHEAAGHWFPWGIGRFDNTVTNFKAAWRRVWTMFRNAGAFDRHAGLAKPVRFMWSEVYPEKRYNPGDRYIDYVGITVLNFGAQRRWRSANYLLTRRVGAAKRASRRPVIVAEMGSHFRGGDKARWLKDAYGIAYRRFPRIKGMMYLDTNEPHLRLGQPDWRLVRPQRADGSMPALGAYRRIVRSANYQGRIR
jgi:hypothetical protein